MNLRLVMFMPKKNVKSCFAKFYCSGGCAANSYNFTGRSMMFMTWDVNCKEKRIECAIMIKAALAGAEGEEENEEE